MLNRKLPSSVDCGTGHTDSITVEKAEPTPLILNFNIQILSWPRKTIDYQHIVSLKKIYSIQIRRYQLLITVK